MTRKREVLAGQQKPGLSSNRPQPDRLQPGATSQLDAVLNKSMMSQDSSLCHSDLPDEATLHLTASGQKLGDSLLGEQRSTYESEYIALLQTKENRHNSVNKLLARRELIAQAVKEPTRGRSYVDSVLRQHQHVQSTMLLPGNLMLQLTLRLAREAFKRREPGSDGTVLVEQ